MKVALLYIDPGSLKDRYPDDFQGRNDSYMKNSVVAALERLGHDVVQLRMGLDAINKLASLKPDVVFNVCDDGFNNESWMEAHIAAVLDMIGVPYTGSGHWALTTCLDKAYTKMVLEHYGLPTPKFYVAESAGDVKHKLKYPVIVKPVREDGSVGVKDDAVAESANELKSRITRILKNYRQPALVEEYIEGREFNVSVIGNEDPVALPVSEILFDSASLPHKIVSYDAKWKSGSKQDRSTPVKCPADINHKLEKKLQGIAVKAYKAMGVTGYGRVDIRMDKKPYILEINPNPDISAGAGLSRSAKAAGVGYDKFIERVLKYGLEIGVGPRGQRIISQK